MTGKTIIHSQLVRSLAKGSCLICNKQYSTLALARAYLQLSISGGFQQIANTPGSISIRHRFDAKCQIEVKSMSIYLGDPGLLLGLVIESILLEIDEI